MPKGILDFSGGNNQFTSTTDKCDCHKHLPASHPVCAIPSSSQSNKPSRLSKAPPGFGEQLREQHMLPGPSSQGASWELWASPGTREVEVGQLCSYSIPRHPGHTKHCTSGKLSCALSVIPAIGFWGTGFTLSGAGELGDGRGAEKSGTRLKKILFCHGKKSFVFS